MNGNQTLMATKGDRVSLEARLGQFHSQYLTTSLAEGNKLTLNEEGKTKLHSFLNEVGYLQDGDKPVYRRLSVDFQTREPVIEVLELRDVLANKNDGFSYIRLSNLEELDAYAQARDARLQGNFWDEGCLALAIAGGLVGALADMIGVVIAYNTDWNPHGAWLLAPPIGGTILGAIFGGILESSGSSKSKEATSFFQKQYAHRIVSGPEAILQALNYSVPSLPRGGE